MPSISNQIPGMAFWVGTGCIICIGLEELLSEKSLAFDFT